ncbi:hypothetical protein [Solirubrobacter soli]|uniref:hypothetical protein n=1 Tax=Solirubrobacter soli TaxID=363832 RepID=UPI000417BE19|nr:hypothetical protein [Solirubrobacter soli]
MLPRVLTAIAVAAAIAPASASAAITRSSVLTPADPLYRVYTPSNKEVENVDVGGSTDGAPGDAVDLLCDETELKRNVAVDKDGRFATTIPITAFGTRECTLRAFPIKLRPKDVAAFTGPRVGITRFGPEYRLVPVSGGKQVAVLDYSVETGPATVHGAGAKAIKNDVWYAASAIKAIAVDGAISYTAADVPLIDQDGRPLAPVGYEGVEAKVRLDPHTNDVTVTETEKIVTCQDKCLGVTDTGVRLVRTIAFTEHHAVADVRDQWVSSDGRPHRIRITHLHGATKTLWRFPGSPAFLPYKPGQRVAVTGPGTILANAGSITYDPAPGEFGFADADLLEDTLEVRNPTTTTRTFTTGDVTIADRRAAPTVTIDGPKNGTILTTPSVTVFGHASDNLGVAGLAVNGRATRLAEDGSFSTTFDLPLGNSRITVTATDAAGQATSATTDVTVVETLKQPQPGIRCTVPAVKRGATLSSVKRKLRNANCDARVVKRRSGVKRGRVIGLATKAGTVRKPGTRIGVKVSRGRR